MKYVLLILLLWTGAALQAQDVEVKRERVFTGTGLYGFMNGGADLYMEYGVKKLTVRDINYLGEDYTLEIYETPSPEDAFGIYSLHTFKCLRADTLDCIDCLSAYQLQAVSGNQYVSVVFPSGSLAAIKKVDEALRKYIPMPGNDRLFLPEILSLEPPYSGRLKYLRGPLSASTASFDFSRLVEGIAYTGIWFISEKPSLSYRALIYVSSPKDVELLKERFPSSDILKSGDNFLYVSGKDL
jgi:hypothetical protein